jgi:hypothetical protein
MPTLLANAGRGLAIWPLVRTGLFYAACILPLHLAPFCLAQKASVAGTGMFPTGTPQKVEKVERISGT